ncbi:response regulator [Terasakiella sp. A23]|uniref:response regulator transcription factor n=1 Tax=Terasakiella sp. FCG-A23 TaxID=3080561 RepID=UPI002953E426|nr:response regulator [Terasakiella sp. A23]MDV7339250.1 response regulator [Terasakiella sp. A23]
MIRPRILIVEDTQSIRMMAASIVETLGGKVVGVANDGIEAEEKFLKHKPDLTLLDIEMPNRNGIDTLSTLLNIQGDAKIVMLTAVGDISVAERCIRLGACGYLMKDFQSPEFKDGLKQLLDTA